MSSVIAGNNPWQEIIDAIWRKIDGDGGELLREWANDQNPSVGLTSFRDNDAADGGFPIEIRSGESPALYIGNLPSQQHSFSPGRTVEFHEQVGVVGCVHSRSGETSRKFLWLVLRALWWDYPRLLGADGTPLEGVKAVTIFRVDREVKKKEEYTFWKWTILMEVQFCVRLSDMGVE